MHKTLFIDLDGTLVFHNYDPSNTDDVFLPGALDFLARAKNLNYYCILTTNRSEDKCSNVLSKLKNDISFEFDRKLFDLPVSIRILINDNKNEQVRAIAIPVLRNHGLTDLTI